MMLRLPCWQHGLHEVSELDAARIVATLTAALYGQEVDPIRSMIEPERTCPRDALAWSHDQEMYAEDVDALFEGIGLDDVEAASR